MFLTKISVRHPVFTVMMMMALVVVGVLSYTRLPVDRMPNVDVPVLSIYTEMPNASPDVVAATVTTPIENAISGISGVKEVTSTSKPGSSVVVVTFNMNTDSNIAFFEVQQKITALQSSLPSGVRMPVISKYDTKSEPIMSLAISSSALNLVELTSLAKQVVLRKLQSAEGVAHAELLGGVSRQLVISPNLQLMKAYGISFNEIGAAIRENNKDISFGKVDNGREVHLIVANGKLETITDFKRVIVGNDGGSPIFLEDIAEVHEGEEEISSVSSYNGHPIVAVDIYKMQTANTVGVTEAVKEVVSSLNDELKEKGIEIIVQKDDSEVIKLLVSNVKNMLIEGAVLTIFIVFLFLNSWRSTVITGLTLPISVIGTFSVVYFLGFSINTLTLLALSLSIGILIDDAIVVRENITRHVHLGKSHLKAALDGTAEIGFAVLATTLSIVAVFLPVAFMDGVLGKLFYEFGMTIVVAVLISLFVSFTLDPMLSSVWFDPASEPNAKRGFIGRLVEKFDNLFQRVGVGYSYLIAWTLVNRIKVLGLFFTFLIGGLIAFSMVRSEPPARADVPYVRISVSVPKGSSVEYTSIKVRQVETILKDIEDIKDVHSVARQSFSAGNQGSVTVNLKPVEERKLTTEELVAEIKLRLNKIAGAEFRTKVPYSGLGGGPSGASDVDRVSMSLSIVGASEKGVENSANRLMSFLNKDSRVDNIYSGVFDTIPAYSMRLRQPIASDLGVNMDSLSSVLRPVVSGVWSSVWDAPNGEATDVVIKMPQTERQTVHQLSALQVTTSYKGKDGKRALVPLNDVIDLYINNQPSYITHKDRLRNINVSFTVEGVERNEYIRELKESIKELNFPDGVNVKFGADIEQQDELVMASLKTGILIIAFLYMILASQFGSFLQPLSIMISLPLAFIGAMLGLLVTGSSLVSIFSIIGILLLAGLVTKNAILLIDYSNQLRSEGMELRQSLVEAGKIRFRPIIMTTMAMILGMLPIAIGTGEGGKELAPMAHAIIGGLVSSTILTLLILPVIITYLDKLENFLIRILPFKVDHKGLKELYTDNKE